MKSLYTARNANHSRIYVIYRFIVSWKSLLVLTFAPCTLTFTFCACSDYHWQQLMVAVFLPQPLSQILHLHPRWFHPLQLVLVVLLLPSLMQKLNLRSGNLHCVVYFGGGGCIILFTLDQWYTYIATCTVFILIGLVCTLQYYTIAVDGCTAWQSASTLHVW